MKHLKYRFLEWDIDVNPFLGQFKQKAIWSRRSRSGLSTRSSPLWWLSGFERRKVNTKLRGEDPSLDVTTLIHFTVRLSMVHNRNKCPSLEKRKTKLRDDGFVSWEKYDKAVIQDILGGNDTNPGYEYAILKSWCDADPSLAQTDRTRFAARVQALVYDTVEDLEGKLGQFAAFLRENMIFDQNNYLAPECMYLPQRHKPKIRTVNCRDERDCGTTIHPTH
ncbi:hypothetical protein F4801DRAFT_557920 [Xylaria longipes]|nr:hypothetical protein F4801DRAFT_557920 [Xylaria longipes]